MGNASSSGGVKRTAAGGPAAGSELARGRVLCVAGEETTLTVRQVADEAKLGVVSAGSIPEALSLLRDGGSWDALVAALGVQGHPETYLFNEGCGDRSDLIEAATALGCVVCVFSHTACANHSHAQACTDAGAHAVVNSADGLRRELTIHAMQSSERDDASGHSCQEANECAPAAGSAAPEYPPISRRAARQQELLQRHGPQHEIVRAIQTQTLALTRMICALPQPLLHTGRADGVCIHRHPSLSKTPLCCAHICGAS
jgi:hypothetical protein